MWLCLFHHFPRIGHMDRLKRVCGYVHKFPQGAIHFHMGIPDHESIFREHAQKYDWMESVYGSPTEDVPQDAPALKGNKVCTMMYKDANLLHDLITGRLASGVPYFLNKTPSDWFLKCQNQVASATYGSEFMVGLSSHRTHHQYSLYIAYAQGPH